MFKKTTKYKTFYETFHLEKPNCGKNKILLCYAWNYIIKKKHDRTLSLLKMVFALSLMTKLALKSIPWLEIQSYFFFSSKLKTHIFPTVWAISSWRTSGRRQPALLILKIKTMVKKRSFSVLGDIFLNI